MRDAQILQLAAEGHKQSEIGAAVGMTQAGVCAALKRMERPSQVIPYTEPDPWDKADDWHEEQRMEAMFGE